MLGKLPDRLGARQQEPRRQQLHFVQYDHTLRDVVKFAASARLAGIKRFEKLDSRSDYDRSIPVLGGKTRLRCFLFEIEVRMMLQNIFRAKESAQDVGGLLDNRCVRNDVDNTFQSMTERMSKSKCSP